MLTIMISDTQLKTIKNRLRFHRDRHEHLKLGHINEALASAFGQKTHAALVTAFKHSEEMQCFDFCEQRFWERLSELTNKTISDLKERLQVDLPGILSETTQSRDLRDIVLFPSELRNQIDHLLKQMAEHGADYFTATGSRIPGWGGIYSDGPKAMRLGFPPPKDYLHWDWDDASTNALRADDFLEDHTQADGVLTSWALEICELLEADLRLGDVVFNSKTGIAVCHDETDGCTQSIIYQRPGQLQDVRNADAP